MPIYEQPAPQMLLLLAAITLMNPAADMFQLLPMARWVAVAMYRRQSHLVPMQLLLDQHLRALQMHQVAVSTGGLKLLT
jgi:hypothetical protein